jgi:hypothetical protein
MMRNLLAFLLILTLFACGGGGGGGTKIVVTGRVLNVDTGAPFSTAATVQTSAASSTTAVADGSFTVQADSGITGLTVLAPSTLGYPVFDFVFPAKTLAVSDVGDLWVGPQKVTLRGTIRNAATSNGIAGAKVSFGGQNGTSATDGTFSIPNVAYSNANTASFLGLVGQVTANNFFSNEFTPNGNLAISGTVDIGEVLMTPLDSDNPPGLPYNIWGIITPSGSASGTIVTLKNTGGTVVRRFTVGSDARYQFWVDPAAYRIEFQNGTLTAPAQNVTLSSTSDVIRADATLN